MIGFAWVADWDRPMALKFAADHKGHGQVRHAKHQAGYHVLACECREHLIVDVPISAQRFDSLPAFPLEQPDGPRVGLDDVAATLRALDGRLRRLERDLGRVSDGAGAG